MVDMALRSGGQTWGEYLSSFSSSSSHVSTWNLPQDKSAERKCSYRKGLVEQGASCVEIFDHLTFVVSC